MGSDLIAGVVAVVLAGAVVALGLRRNLSATTRDGLPRFEGESDRETATLGMYEGGERRRRRPTPRERRWLVCLALFLALAQVVFAVLDPDEWPWRAAFAVGWVIAAVVTWRRKPAEP